MERVSEEQARGASAGSHAATVPWPVGRTVVPWARWPVGRTVNRAH
jgi:hypothetical protein